MGGQVQCVIEEQHSGVCTAHPGFDILHPAIAAQTIVGIRQLHFRFQSHGTPEEGETLGGDVADVHRTDGRTKGEDLVCDPGVEYILPVAAIGPDGELAKQVNGFNVGFVAQAVDERFGSLTCAVVKRVEHIIDMLGLVVVQLQDDLVFTNVGQRCDIAPAEGGVNDTGIGQLGFLTVDADAGVFQRFHFQRQDIGNILGVEPVAQPHIPVLPPAQQQVRNGHDGQVFRKVLAVVGKGSGVQGKGVLHRSSQLHLLFQGDGNGCGWGGRNAPGIVIPEQNYGFAGGQGQLSDDAVGSFVKLHTAAGPGHGVEPESAAEGKLKADGFLLFHGEVYGVQEAALFAVAKGSPDGRIPAGEPAVVIGDSVKVCIGAQETQIGGVTVHQIRRFACQVQPAAVGSIDPEQIHSGMVQATHLGNDHAVIAALADGDGGTVHAAVLFHQPLVGVMVADAGGTEAGGQLLEGVIQFCNAVPVISAVEGQIGAVHGVDDQHPRIFLCFCQQVTQIGVVGVELIQLLCPGIVQGVECGIVPLPLAPDGVRIKVVAHHIYAVDILDVCQAFEFLGSDVPAGAAEGLGDGMFFAQLLGGRG